MSHPPRVLESVLKGLGADPYLTEVVLGDLAEEYDERAAFDGEADARRWYRGEAMRSVPHLLRSALGRLRLGDVPRLVGNALFAWLALLPVSLTLYIVLAVFLRAFGLDWTLRASPQDGAFVVFAMLSMPVAGIAGGYIAAWRNARAPLIGALAFGIVLTSINLIAGLFFPGPLPAVLRIAALAMFNAGAIVGGAIRTARPVAEPNAASS
jgi:hypothetical protein